MKKLLILLFLIITTSYSYGNEKYCSKIDTFFKKYHWGKSNCNDYEFKNERVSNLKNLLIYTEIGDKDAEETIILMCGVHGDEITPVKFCFDFLKNYKGKKLNKRIVIAPLVSPDSFLVNKPSRTNSLGVDVNRNFPTEDWTKDALRKWKYRYSKDKRKFPGNKAGSEMETLFQMDLVNRYNPSFIISVHAPLFLIDYDGPKFDVDGSENDYLKILSELSKKAKNYKIKDYPFFPGSLGNWAGNERKIPTYTLELPSSDYTKHKIFWNSFKELLSFLIKKDLKKES